MAGFISRYTHSGCFLCAENLRGGGGKGRAIKEKFTFKRLKKISIAIKLEGGEGKALIAWPFLEDLFCGFPPPKKNLLRIRTSITKLDLGQKNIIQLQKSLLRFWLRVLKSKPDLFSIRQRTRIRLRNRSVAKI